MLEIDKKNSVHVDIVGRCLRVARVALMGGVTRRWRIKQQEIVSFHWMRYLECEIYVPDLSTMCIREAKYG